MCGPVMDLQPVWMSNLLIGLVNDNLVKFWFMYDVLIQTIRHWILSVLI